MATLNISIPDTMKDWINQQISAGQYTSASDYLRDLVRSDQRAKQSIDELLLEGLNSGEPITPGEDYWKNKKNNLKTKMGQ
jgi:antitoxin ParD1/3/4